MLQAWSGTGPRALSAADPDALLATGRPAAPGRPGSTLETLDAIVFLLREKTPQNLSYVLSVRLSFIRLAERRLLLDIRLPPRFAKQTYPAQSASKIYIYIYILKHPATVLSILLVFYFYLCIP